MLPFALKMQSPVQNLRAIIVRVGKTWKLGKRVYSIFGAVLMMWVDADDLINKSQVKPITKYIGVGWVPVRVLQRGFDPTEEEAKFWNSSCQHATSNVLSSTQEYYNFL